MKLRTAVVFVAHVTYSEPAIIEEEINCQLNYDSCAGNQECFRVLNFLIF